MRRRESPARFVDPADDAAFDVITPSAGRGNAHARRNRLRDFIFTPDLAHAVQVCEEGFLVPFAKLSPWLSAEGARNVAALRAEVGRQR